MKLVTIDPRRIELADYGVLHLAPAAGHERRGDARARARRASATGSIDRDVRRAAHRGLRGRCEELLAAYTPEAGRGDHRRPGRRHRARGAHLRRGAPTPRSPGASASPSTSYGSEVVRLICNLALMTGKIGRPGSALLPLRGQNNVQGSSDMGALPDTYTAYRSVGDEEVARSFEERWGVPLRREKGYTIPADVRRRGRRRAEGDVDLRRGRRPDRPQHHARHPRARVARVPRLPGDLRDRDDASTPT